MFTSFKQKLVSRIARFRSDQDGSATVEFAMVFPLYIVLLMSAFESGMLMTRQAMLERGVDMAVRNVRIGVMNPVDHDTLLTSICANAGIIPSCETEVKIEMRRVDLTNWAGFPNTADCIDRDDYALPLEEFQAGSANELMVIRVCALFDPVFPNLGLGKQLPRESQDAYALISSSAFVIEPL